MLLMFFTICLLDMRRDVQEIFKATPHEKQVMMFSATLSKEVRPVCKKFMQDVSIATFSTLMETSCYAARMQTFARQIAQQLPCNSTILRLWEITKFSFAML